MIPNRYLLWCDGCGGMIVGVTMILASSWARTLYGMSTAMYFGIASGNLAYGLYSLSLAMKTQRSAAGISFLALANATWGVGCAVTAVRVHTRVSAFGLAHLLLESGFVIYLARAEWRGRRLLAQNG